MARCSGVCRDALRASTSPPRCRASARVSHSPCDASQCGHVMPLSSATVREGLALASMMWRAAASEQTSHAISSGVRRHASWACTSAPCRTSSSTHSAGPSTLTSTARCSGVCPSAPTWAGCGYRSEPAPISRNRAPRAHHLDHQRCVLRQVSLDSLQVAADDGFPGLLDCRRRRRGLKSIRPLLRPRLLRRAHRRRHRRPPHQHRIDAGAGAIGAQAILRSKRVWSFGDSIQVSLRSFCCLTLANWGHWHSHWREWGAGGVYKARRHRAPGDLGRGREVPVRRR